MCDAIYITSLSVLHQVSLRLCVATALISCTSGCLALTGTSILNLTGPFCANNACIPYIVNRPNSEAHQAVMRQAYDNAGLALSETAMVEAHGTGTKIGDPIEARAIANCFGNQALYLGAVGEILFLTR